MQTQLSEEKIRLFLMDKKELNPLLRAVRFDTAMISSAIDFCVDYYNETPPFVDTFNNHTYPYRYNLLTGVSGFLLRSASVQQASNNLTYSSSDVQVSDNDKAEIFQRIGGILWDEFKTRVTEIKMTKNLANCFGSQPSELIYMAR